MSPQDKARWAKVIAAVVEDVLVDMSAHPGLDVSEHSRAILCAAFAAIVVEVHDGAVDDIVAVVERSGQPWSEACVAGIRAAFPKVDAP